MFRLDPALPFFFFNDTATTEIYTLSLHDALPISEWGHVGQRLIGRRVLSVHVVCRPLQVQKYGGMRSEEHTSELQSQSNLVCRLLLEKKKPGPEQVSLKEGARPLRVGGHDRSDIS